jgi:hypothetical protein
MNFLPTLEVEAAMLNLKAIRFLLVGAVLVSCVGVGRADASDRLNGFDWNKADQGYKVGYINGYIDAAVKEEAVLNIELRDLELLSAKDRQLLATEKNDWDYLNITYGQLLEGMNNFYNDNLNKAISWSTALSYVRGSIHGEPKDVLERKLNLDRKLATEN